MSAAPYVFDEVYERHLTTDVFVDSILSKLGARGIEASQFVGDPSTP